MGNKITGTATIRVDGKEYKSKDGASGSLGGYARTPVMGGNHVHGYSEAVETPELNFTLAHDDSLSVQAIAGWVNSTVIMETDTGVQFIFREAWTAEPPGIDSGAGEVSVKMNAKYADEVLP